MFSFVDEPVSNQGTAHERDPSVPPVDARCARSLTCHICMENIVTANKRFALQNNCDHFFCFDCLSTWRRTNDRETGSRCPLCRIRSTFIAPSWRCFTDTNDKEKLIDLHKHKLKRRPCRTFTRHGCCRFENRCYYRHRNASEQLYQQSTDDSREHPSFESTSVRRAVYGAHRHRPY